jgi:hypothetical protein
MHAAHEAALAACAEEGAWLPLLPVNAHGTMILSYTIAIDCSAYMSAPSPGHFNALFAGIIVLSSTISLSS